MSVAETRRSATHGFDVGRGLTCLAGVGRNAAPTSIHLALVGPPSLAILDGLCLAGWLGTIGQSLVSGLEKQTTGECYDAIG